MIPLTVRRNAIARALSLASGVCASFSISAADLNTAPQAELERIKGIGPEVSQRILDTRGQRPFTDWDDAMRRLKGLGPATARRWSEQGLTVQGQPYAAAAPLPASAASGAPR